MTDDLLLTLPDESPAPRHAAPTTGSGAAAHAHAARGEWTDAERLFDEARAAAARAGDAVALAVALTNRGHALARLGRLEEAALMLDAALDARRRLHASGVAGEGVVARGIADVAAVAAALGDVSEAARLLRRARAHALAGAAHEVIRQIDERLEAARALGAVEESVAPAVADDASDALALDVPELESLALDDAGTAPLLLVDPGVAPLALDDLGVESIEDEAPRSAPGSGLLFLDAEPLEEAAPAASVPALDVPPLAVEPTADALPPLLDEPALEPALDALPLLVDEPALDTLPLIADEPALQLGPTIGSAALDDLAPALELAPAMEATEEGPLADDPWSLADPAPFDGLDAEAVHRRAVALETPHAPHIAIAAVEPCALASADAFPPCDEEAEDAIPPAPSFPEVYESPLEPGAAAVATAAPVTPRRRTTRDVPLVSPPEQKRPWWRRLTSRGPG